MTDDAILALEVVVNLRKIWLNLLLKFILNLWDLTCFRYFYFNLGWLLLIILLIFWKIKSEQSDWIICVICIRFFYRLNFIAIIIVIQIVTIIWFFPRCHLTSHHYKHRISFYSLFFSILLLQKLFHPFTLFSQNAINC